MKPNSSNNSRPIESLLVTGGCGFIGSNFIRFLLEGAGFSGRVINLDKLTYAGNPDNLKDLAGRFADRYSFIQADLADYGAVERVFEKHDIDAVCHFAAESHVDRSIASPRPFIQSNVVGTFNLLEAARKQEGRSLLFHHISTDEVFGSLGHEGAFTEQSPYRPSSPYSASKAASDHLVRAYGITYGLDVTLSNCSNNYGPYQFPEKLIPLMVTNALEGLSLPVYGNGQNIRDWLFVHDHCRAIWDIMKRGRLGETYNVGGGAEISNIRLVEKICDLVDRHAGPLPTGPRRSLISFVPDRQGHDFRYAMDFSRLTEELGWKPAESFESGLEKTVLWYLKHPQWVARIHSGQYRESF